MPRRIDANQVEIVKLARKMGISVLILSDVGKGCPDTLWGVNCQNYLVEIKDGSKPRSQQKLTHLEQKFFDEWRGDVRVINSVDAAIEFINSIRDGS